MQENDSVVRLLDLGVKDGKFVEIAKAGSVQADRATAVHDAKGLMAFPGVVDAHTHIAGIYQDIELDMFQESKCAAQGGVTTVMPYIRSGQCYLWEGGAYKDLYQKFLDHATDNYHCDYAYHVSPIEGQHIGELEWLIKDQGVVSLGEVFMFYGQHGLHDFDILNMLGEGAFGKVLLVRHRTEKKQYAMKVMLKEAVAKANNEEQVTFDSLMHLESF